MADEAEKKEEQKQSPLQEIVQPFIDLVRAPRALMGIYVSYFFEGLVYFGILTILGKYMSENVGLTDQWAGLMYGFFTAGITLAMLFLGAVPDKVGIRKGLLLALGLMLVGRILLALSGMESIFTQEEGLGSAMFWTVAAGLFIVVVGYGIYQPASYAGVRKFTDEKTATMGYAVIYALMNLGAFFAGLIASPVRQSMGIDAVYWAFVFFNACAFLAVFFILTRKTEIETAAAMKAKRTEGAENGGKEKAAKNEGLPSAWTPGRKKLFAAGCAGVLLAGAGVVYQIASRPVPAYEEGIKKLVEHQEATVKTASKAVEKTTGMKAGDALSGPWFDQLQAALDGWSTHSGRASRDLAAPPEFSGTWDPQGVTCLKRFFESQGRYALDLKATDGILAPLKGTTEGALRRARDLLRSHGIFTMAVAYSMVAPVDEAVVERLRKRFKRPREEIIPMDAGLAAKAVAAAQSPMPEKMQHYGAQCRASAEALEKAVPSGALAPVAAWLRESGGFAESLAGRIRGEGTEAARKILSHKLLADGDYALKTGQELVEEQKEEGIMDLISGLVEKAVGAVAKLFGKGEEKASAETSNLTYLRDGLRAAKGTTDTARDDLGEVFRVPTKEVLQSFTFRYGPVLLVLVICLILALHAFLKAKPDHPFNNIRFVYFIFILIPVQTLFAHNWLTLPYYINRAFGGTWAGDWFEFLSNLNPILIFVLAPVIAALTARANVFTMILTGTFIMAVPTFLLVLPPRVWILLAYILIMTVGEALWQPRFLQYVAELAPEGKTGIYMGIAQFPWFLTKVVTALYSGWFLSQYCPRIGPQSPETLWLYYGIIAMISPVALVFTSKWIQRGMKTRTNGNG